MVKAALSDFHPCLIEAAVELAPAADDFAALLEAVRRGDERAFTELHERLALPLYRRLLSLTRGEAALSRELAQSALLQLARRPPALATADALLGWLLRVARNAWIDQLRKQKREARVPLEDFDAATTSELPLTGLLREILATLPAEEGELLQAAYVDERPLAEIAAEHLLTYKALEGRLSRLRATVRERLLRLLRHDS